MPSARRPLATAAEPETHNGAPRARAFGVVFDVERRLSEEFFSAATDFQLLATLCSPDTTAGGMLAFDVLDWSTAEPTPERDGEVVVNVRQRGWSTAEPPL